MMQKIIMNLMLMRAIAMAKLNKFFSNEDGLQIVEIVVIIGIVVLLALIFKKQIQTLLETLFGTITENATGAVGGNPPTE